MTKARVIETDSGIQGEMTVAQYDEMERVMRDRGWMETNALLESGITSGTALEIGHGPGYLGLEWLKFTINTRVIGLDISPDMQKMAQKNAEEYGFADRTEYHLGNCDSLPFEENTFDAVFTNGSLHEWSRPQQAFNEIWRVLKPGGKYYVSDLRRDMSAFVRGFLWLGTKPAAIRPGLLTSIGAAYTPEELSEMIKETALKSGIVKGNAIGLELMGEKV